MTSGFDLVHDAPWLLARFAAPQRMLSWALNRPGFQTADRVAWLEIRNADLPPETDPLAYFADRLAAAGLERAVGLLTSRDLAQCQRAGVGADRQQRRHSCAYPATRRGIRQG